MTVPGTESETWRARRWQVYGDRITRSGPAGYGGADDDHRCATAELLAESVNADYDRYEAEARAGRLTLEHYEDLHDWAKRWQAGRKANNALMSKARAEGWDGNLSAEIIVKAGELNRELDTILAAIDALNQEGQR